MNISTVILTNNNESIIQKCIKSVSFSDEIIVVDDFSADRSRIEAKNEGARVYKRRLNDNFAQQRNFALSKAKGKWVLFIDSDEVVTKELADEIIQVTANPFIRTEGFYIKRLDFMWGKKIKHGEMGNTKLLRLARNGAGKWKRSVHEYWDVIGRVKTLNNPIYHYPHEDLKKFIASVNWFSSLHAKENMKEGKRSNLIKIILWPIAHFLVNWILKLGFLDGVRGFVIALIMSFHSFLAWSKLWIYQKNYKQR
jgi:glycosyltransferase involved in cell wall biosynthesis